MPNNQLTAQVIPGFLPPDGQKITPAMLRQMATPTVNIVGAVSSASISDGSITAAKLASSVAGSGLTGGLGAPLAVFVDGTSMEINGSLQVAIAPAGVQLQHLAFGGFVGCSAYVAGIEGLVPTPPVGAQTSFLRGDGKWAQPAANPGYAVWAAKNLS